ncbi:MAG: 30S ribosome-binding factor RbfA [Chromatiales bacterium]|nr:MAG: 30S ribosome-binding factor RbfA [Chromatiales bacterium]
MPREFPRSRRVEEQIHRILSDVLRTDARDPALHHAVITEVRVSRDLSVAWVYVTSLDAEADRDVLLEACRRAAGFLRSAVASELSVRQVPELRFRIDDTAERAAQMDALIDSVVDHDADSDEQEPGNGT